MTVKTIWHVGAWNLNYGDRVLQAATQKIIRGRFDGKINFVNIDIQRTWFSPQLIDKLNAEADMLVIGGGGLIFHRPMDRSHSGWQFNVDINDIDKINVPISVYGIGYNKFPYDTHVFPKSMWESLQKVIDKSVAFSVRNNGTYETMEQAGLDMSKVTVVPDSAMFLDSFSFNHPQLDTDKLKIGLNWATDRWHQRFKSEEIACQALDTTLNVLKEKSQEYDAKLYLIEHLMPNETNARYKEYARKRFKKILDGTSCCVLYEDMNQELYPPFDYLAPFLVDIYRQMDVVLGMRGHANILSFGQNTPCIGLGEHNKVKWFLEDVDLGNLVVPLGKDTEDDILDLRSAIDEVVNNITTYKTSMDAKKTQLDIIKNTFIDKIIEALR